MEIKGCRLWVHQGCSVWALNENQKARVCHAGKERSDCQSSVRPVQNQLRQEPNARCCNRQELAGFAP